MKRKFLFWVSLVFLPTLALAKGYDENFLGPECFNCDSSPVYVVFGVDFREEANCDLSHLGCYSGCLLVIFDQAEILREINILQIGGKRLRRASGSFENENRAREFIEENCCCGSRQQ